MSEEESDPALAARCARLAVVCAIMVAALGAIVLTGWWRDIAALKGAWAQSVGIAPHTALAFLLAGASLALAGRTPPPAGRHRVRLALAAVVTLLGLLTLGACFMGVAPAAERLLLLDPSPAIGSVSTAGGLALAGLALALLDWRHGTVAYQTAALACTLIGTLALLGHAYRVPALQQAVASGMSLEAAIGLVVLSLGVFLARPRRGLMAVVTSTTAGGVMARRLLPFALVAPFVVGWLRVEGERGGHFTSDVGIVLVAVIYVLLFTVFIWRTADVLRHSDRRRFAAEAARLRQQAQLHGIIDSAMDAIVLVDAAQRVVLFNPAAEQMFGRDEADVVGGPLDALMPERLRARHFAGIQSYGSADASGGRTGRLAAISGLRANGEEFPLEASVSGLVAGGQRYFVAILRDVTESRRVADALRQSEERERVRSEELAALLDAVPAAVWFTHDPQAAVITGNRLSEQWLRVSEADNVALSAPAARGAGESRLFKDGVEIRPADLPLRRAARGLEVRDCEIEVVLPDGARRYALGNATPLRDANGGIRGAISAFVDITARREAELATRAARAEAERANNAKSRFLAAASHDLRQPLSALSLYVKVLKGHVSAGGQPLLANLDDCIGSLSELLTDLLDLSKLEAGVVTPQACDFPVADLLHGLVAVHAPEAQLKGLQLRCAASQRVAHTDPVLLRRILGNFIANAVRYTERGGVLVGCRRRQGRMWVEVWDTGIGIPTDKTDEIFEEFRQLGDEARTRGSGLGLAIVARTAALLGLAIRVRSVPGRGSLFAVEMPVGEQQVVPVRRPPAVARRSLRVALVEDNPMVRRALEEVLASIGHRVVAADSGPALRAALGSSTPDVVVSDYRLGHGETGFDVIRAARAAIRPDLPAILVTGDTDPKLVRSMADRGIVVLHKPVELRALQACLEEVVPRGEMTPDRDCPART